MATPKFQSPFPPVELGYDDKKELCRIAKRAVDTTVDAFERFVWTDGCEVSTSRYVVLKASDDVRVYHERRGGAVGAANENRGRDVEALLTVGSVVGTLDDAMYGVLNPTTDAMRIKAAYMNELASLGNCAVLATVQEPKADKPFRSLSLKWLVRTLPMPARALMKPRDMVFVEATGTKRLENGERIGFHLIQSVDHLQALRTLPTYVRSTASVCAIWRQLTADRVQVYVKSFLDVPERLLASVTLKSAAESLVAVWRHVHCAQMKKLAWLLRRQLPALDATGKGGGDKPAAVVSRCKVCTAKAKTLCLVCAKAVCAKCRVKRELWTLEGGGGLGAGEGELVEQRVAFCVPCLTVAIRQSAADVARDEIPDHGDVFKVPSSTRSRRVGGGGGRGSGSGSASGSSGKARSYRARESGSSSTSSERTLDTQDSLSRASSRPQMNLSM